MNRARTVLSHVMHAAGTPDNVFPLLCPVRETDWIAEWRCELVYSQSGRAELDCVFQTDFPQDGPTDTWVVSRYEPPRAIEFVRTNAWRVIRYAITVEDTAAGRSSWRWTQTITALNDEGDALVATASGDAFAAKIATLERKLNHFLTTGRRLPADNG